MGQEEKSALWAELKNAGVTFDQHYRNYTEDQLRAAVTEFRSRQAAVQPEPEPLVPGQIIFPETPTQPAVVAPDMSHIAGATLNSHPEDEPIEVEESGRIWYQREVRKPVGAQPRGRRVLDYTDTGVKQQTITNGEFTESFEMPGDRAGVRMQAKITLPSYQAGIYKDPGLPFRVHVYNEVRGFDFFEVNDYYGGADLVPTDITRMYVQNVLCYDIRTVIRAIQAEARRLGVLGGLATDHH